METALNHNANLFIQNAVCSVGISSTEKGILRLKAVLPRESMCKYAPIFLRRAFDLLFTYYLEFEKKFKGECSTPLVNPSGSISKYIQNPTAGHHAHCQQVITIPRLGLLQQPHHISLLPPSNLHSPSPKQKIL